MKKKSLLASVTAGVAALALVLTGCAGESKPVVTEEAAAVIDHTGETLNIDFATYNPLSLLIKNYGWLEEELAETGIKVNWVQSLSSADANAKLLAGALDVGSTAGSAALLARSNGSPIKTIEIFDQPEWAALAVGPDSKIKDVADLEGKTVAMLLGNGGDPLDYLEVVGRGHPITRPSAPFAAVPTTGRSSAARTVASAMVEAVLQAITTSCGL